MSYVHWSLLGMVAYSLVSLFVKLATKSGVLSSFAVLAIATTIVAISAIGIAVTGGHFKALRSEDYLGISALWSLAAGLFLIIAVGSLFKALSMGPASEVVPIYGMFVVGGSVLGFVFLGESMNISKLAGIGLAVGAIYLIAK